MEIASSFIAVLIVALVTVAFSPTLSKRIARKWYDADANQPSQRILDIVSAMASTEKIAPPPTSSKMPTSADRETSELMPDQRVAKVRISA